MYAVSASYATDSSAHTQSALLIFFVCAASALLVANLALIGAGVGARAETARAQSRAKTTLLHIAELESQVAHAKAPIATAASFASFVTPLSFSYAVARPLGSAVSPNDL